MKAAIPVAACLVTCAATAAAQTVSPAAPAQAVPAATADAPTLCGQPVPAPAALPPAGSGPLVYVLGLCFAAQGNTSAVEPETYLYYLRLRPSRPSQRAMP